MSILFGPMRQIGYVVRDIESAMHHWIEVNRVGPWFYTQQFVVNEFWYRGKRQEKLEISAALANCGDMKLELIQQRCKTPSLFREFIDAHGEGMQHFAVWADNYDALYKSALDSNYTIGQEARLSRGRLAYLLKEKGHPGTITEVLEMTPGRHEIFAAIRDAARHWDGRDPIRTS